MIFILDFRVFAFIPTISYGPPGYTVSLLFVIWYIQNVHLPPLGLVKKFSLDIRKLENRLNVIMCRLMISKQTIFYFNKTKCKYIIYEFD